MNSAAAKLLGLPREQIIGRLIEDFLPPHRREIVEQEWEQFVTGETFSAEWELTRGDGTILHVDASARPNFLPGLNIAFVRDLTERKRLEHQLLQSQRLESMGRLAGGIAHDFNNLLTAISGYTSLLLARPANDAELAEDLTEIERAAKRAAELTRQLLAFGGRQVLQPFPLDLNEIVDEVRSMLGRLIGEHVTLVTLLEPDIGTVLADPGQLEQVVVNLVVNARDAMPDGGTLSIITHDTERDGLRFVALEVRDTGSGMDEETKERIFEPFFTTRQDGVGLGLASVYGIVAQSEGRIEVTSKPGGGSTFTLLLPHVEAAPPKPESPPSATPARGSETVLLVEDEEVVRALARRVLEQQGYTVLETVNGHEAIGIAETHEGSIDLLLTDVVMPGLRGQEVAKRVADARPGIRIVYMSGYTDDALLGEAAGGSAHFLEKPFSNVALAEKIREALS